MTSRLWVLFPLCTECYCFTPFPIILLLAGCCSFSVRQTKHTCHGPYINIALASWQARFLEEGYTAGHQEVSMCSCHPPPHCVPRCGLCNSSQDLDTHWAPQTPVHWSSTAQNQDSISWTKMSLPWLEPPQAWISGPGPPQRYRLLS